MKISIRVKLLSAFSVLLVFFTTTLIISLIRINSLHESVVRTHAHTLTVTNSASQIMVIVQSGHGVLVDVTLADTEGAINDNINLLDTKEKEALKHFDIIQKQILGDEGRKLEAIARKMFINWRNIRQEAIELVRAGEIRKAQKHIKTTRAGYVSSINIQLRKILHYASDKALEFNKESRSIAVSTRNFIIIALIISIIIAVLAAFYLANSITNRLGTIGTAAASMASGKFAHKIHIKGNDELNDLAENFSSMGKQLEESYGSLEKKVKERTLGLDEANQKLILMRDRLELTVSERTKELADKDKRQKAMLYMIEDMNETSRMLKTTQEALLRKEKLSVLGQFSGSLSHELRNPLAVIDSSIYFLNMKLKDNEDIVDAHLKRIESSVAEATSIIQSMLDLSKDENPKLTKCDLKTILLDSISRVKFPDSIKVIQDFSDDKYLVLAEHTQLTIAFKNILKNAVDAIKGEGEISVKVRRLQDSQVEISFKNTGESISPDKHDLIFQPLYSAKIHGIGFGLSITKMVVEKHNGTINIESEPGKGTNFVVNLPIPELL